MKARKEHDDSTARERQSARKAVFKHTADSLEPWLRLREIEGLGNLTILSLVRTWTSPAAVLQAAPDELIQKGYSKRLADMIARGPSDDACRRIARELAAFERMSLEVRTVLDESYPARLHMIPDPPPVLYISGTISDEDDLAVAIVGARRATASGRVLTEALAADLACRGVTVVSGLARGVDAATHRGALDGGGRTIAVLGCGIDRTYPVEHEQSRHRIEERGAVLSELPIGASPQSHNFPRRNRIISGLSLGVVVTEAAINSGSLITARLAAEQGREVFAVPGFVREETSRGTNALIKEGAALIESAEDVIESLRPQLDPSMRVQLRQPHVEKNARDNFGIQERLVYDALSYEPKTVDRIAEETHVAVSIVMAALLSLELLKRVRQLSGQGYIRL